MRYDTVLFDLDGTLVDSGAMILASFRHATKTVLDREFADEQLAALVGSPLTKQMRELDEERADELIAVYRSHNEPLHADLLAFDGIEDLLAQLRDEGRKLGIVTSKRGATVRLAFDVVPIEHYFGVVVTSDDTQAHKPDAEPILHALFALDAEPARAVYVGDSPFDVQAAKAAGIASIAVAWGGLHSAERLAEEAPDALVSTPEELLGRL